MARSRAVACPQSSELASARLSGGVGSCQTCRRLFLTSAVRRVQPSFARSVFVLVIALSAGCAGSRGDRLWVSPSLTAFVSAPLGGSVRSTIVGHVTRGPYGQASAGVVVVLRQIDVDGDNQTLLTDQDGVFTYADVQAGTYELIFYGLDGAGQGQISRRFVVGHPPGTILVDARWLAG